MIRKILVQDIVSKRSAKSGKDAKESGDSENHISSARERDFLIERLTRKHATEAAPKAPTKSAAKSGRSTTRRKRNFSFGNKWIWYSLPVVLILVIFLLLQFFSGAIVTVTPKHLTVATSTTLVASIDATTSPGVLMYQIITLSSKDGLAVEANGVLNKIATKAAGQIMIFNNFSQSSQTLVKNTRFETKDGLIYRTTSAVSVPGVVNGTPGSIVVSVVADQAGSKYNIGLSDFTIPGFKTDNARYSKIFGRSKTEMTGGADANSVSVADGVRQNTVAQIDAGLKTSLLKQVQAEKSADSVIFDAASKVTFQHLPDTAGSDAKHVVIHEQATISSVVFDKKMIGKTLLGDTIAKVGNNAEVHGIESLQFIPQVATTTQVWQAKPFNFSLAGSMDVVGVVDATKLIQDLRGVARSSLPSLMSQYPTVDKIDVVIKPFWKTTFPTDISKIKVQITK